MGAPQVRISELARRLVKSGHQVTVLTTLPNYPSGIVPQDYRHGARRHEIRDGVSILRLWSYTSPNKGFLRRILAQLSFGCLAGFAPFPKGSAPDLLIIESPPLFDAIGGRLLAWRYRCPYIFTVADIWPESAVQLGMLRNRALIWLAERLEWSTYRHAKAVWAVTQGIRQALIQRGLPARQVFFLPNGVDTKKFRPLPQAQARAALGWSDAFTLLYAGTIGLAHGLMTVLDAAEQLREDSTIRLVLVGDGAAKAALMAEAERRALRNVSFMAAQPHERMPLLLAAADACLVSVRDVPLFKSALPSKTYEAMAAARPIILAANGEVEQLIVQEAGAAVHVAPENAEELAQAILRLRSRPDLCQRLGAQGRAFVERAFDRDVLAKALEIKISAMLSN